MEGCNKRSLNVYKYTVPSSVCYELRSSYAVHSAVIVVVIWMHYSSYTTTAAWAWCNPYKYIHKWVYATKRLTFLICFMTCYFNRRKCYAKRILFSFLFLVVGNKNVRMKNLLNENVLESIRNEVFSGIFVLNIQKFGWRFHYFHSHMDIICKLPLEVFWRFFVCLLVRRWMNSAKQRISVCTDVLLGLNVCVSSVE